jgi:hypothetical protein
MRDRWYGDNRDLVKWGVLLKLASQRGANRIVQVAYYRQETVNIDGCKCPIPQAVTKHFAKDLRHISRLNTPGVEIHVVDIEWTKEGRASGGYVEEVQSVVEQARTDSPCVVFLDPDIGLEPPDGTPKLKHVLESELQQIWKEVVRENDVLVFYQHRPRGAKGNSWIKPKREQFERALQLDKGEAKIAQGETATDVVFFIAQKSPPTERTKTAQKECPECDHVFKGNGFDGIDAHWRAKHKDIMPYEKAWALIKAGDYERRPRP